jgi:hypothetical protein
MPLRKAFWFGDRRWVWPFAIAAVIILIGLFWLPYRERAVGQQCRALYANAKSAVDTTAVDAMAPANSNPKFAGMAVLCGDLRLRKRL